MSIHHTKVKQAIALGCHISQADEHKFRIFWPQRAVELFGSTIDESLHEMEAAQDILNNHVDYKLITNGVDCQVVLVDDVARKRMAGTPASPSNISSVLEANEAQWVAEDMPSIMSIVRDNIGGIAKDGGIAYRQGVPASDCPYDEAEDGFTRWNDEWDTAADKATAEPERPKVGSVVTNRYRAQYSESGHPTHCGDALAILLNSLCSNKAGTNLAIFERICAANKVDLSKYNRTTKGWQGRLRMTGRNLLAKRVVENNGKLMMPEGMGQDHFQLDRDWILQTINKYKPKVT